MPLNSEKASPEDGYEPDGLPGLAFLFLWAFLPLRRRICADR